LKKAGHHLEISKILHKTLVNAMSAKDYYGAQRDLLIAEIELQKQQRKKDHLILKRHLYSPAQVEEADRKLKLATINRRSAEIRLHTAREGVDASEIRASQIEVERKRGVHEDERLMQQKENLDHKYRLKSLQKRVRDWEKEVQKYTQDMERFSVKAMEQGIIQYANIWDGVRMSKLRPNVGVWNGQRVMMLTNQQKMKVELMVPEKYYENVNIGQSVDVEILGMKEGRIKGEVVSLHSMFEEKKRPDTEEITIYSRQESLGYQVFKVSIRLLKEGLPFKAGAVVKVKFPFGAFKS
jgi:multidrug resistance efflux pump